MRKLAITIIALMALIGSAFAQEINFDGVEIYRGGTVKGDIESDKCLREDRLTLAEVSKAINADKSYYKEEGYKLKSQNLRSFNGSYDFRYSEIAFQVMKECGWVYIRDYAADVHIMVYYLGGYKYYDVWWARDTDAPKEVR